MPYYPDSRRCNTAWKHAVITVLFQDDASHVDCVGKPEAKHSMLMASDKDTFARGDFDIA